MTPGWASPPTTPDGAARRVKASAVRTPLVAALDDWAVCSSDDIRRDWVLRVARGADPDAWRDRVRDPAAWRDVVALAELARAAPVAEQPPPLLLALGERLHLAGGDGIGLLRRVADQYPDDFWVNFTLARALYGAFRQGKGDWVAATPYYQKALDLRPKAGAVQNNLGLVLVDVGWLEDNADGRWGPGAITTFRRALRIDPNFAPARNNLGLCLKRAGVWMVAFQEYQDALLANPELAPAHFNLGEIDAGSGRINDAIDHYREALRLDPDFAFAHYFLGLALLAKGRCDEVFADYPVGVESLNLLRGSAIGEATDYYNKAYDFDPNWVAARNGLHIPLQDGVRLDEAIDHYRQAIRLDPRRPISTGPSARRSWPNGSSPKRTPPSAAVSNSSRRRKRTAVGISNACESAAVTFWPWKAAWPASFGARTSRPPASSWMRPNSVSSRTTTPRPLASMPRRSQPQPQLTEDLRAGHRFNAASAAALAGGGHGDDVAGLGEQEREALRKQARNWLRLDLAAWAKKLDTGTDGGSHPGSEDVGALAGRPRPGWAARR